MNDAYFGPQTRQISGDLAEMIKSYLTADTADEILDLEIYENHLGDRCVAAAVKTEYWGRSIVQGVIVVVRPKPEAGTDFYQIDALADTDGPYANFCPERILDILTPTDDRMALEWRERCRQRLSNKPGAVPSRWTRAHPRRVRDHRR